jgi:thiamine pyrophosphokinase
MSKKAVLFLNGKYAEFEPRLAHIDPSMLIIGVDGGTRFLLASNLQPNVVIGDLDSLTEAEIKRITQAGCEIIRYPTHKAKTDFELAVNYATSKDCNDIMIFGGLYGRIDHMLANILLPTYIGNPNLLYIHGADELFFIHKKAVIAGQRGDIVSLIPINSIVTGVRTRGLEYPLNNETLYPGKSRGVSNVLISSQAEVSINTGQLLCVHLSCTNLVYQARS